MSPRYTQDCNGRNALNYRYNGRNAQILKKWLPRTSSNALLCKELLSELKMRKQRRREKKGNKREKQREEESEKREIEIKREKKREKERKETFNAKYPSQEQLIKITFLNIYLK